MDKLRRGVVEGLAEPGAMVAEIKTAPVPELSRREQQASAAVLIIALETLVDEAEVAREDEPLNWKEIKKNADLVILYLAWLAEGSAEQGEAARPISLEDFKKPLVAALVFLFRRLPEFYRLCTQAPPVSLEDGSNELYNPIYVAYQQAVRQLTKKPNGEDPSRLRSRRDRVLLFTNPGAEKGAKIRNISEPRNLEIASLKNIEIENGAVALLELLREEKTFLQDEVLKKDAETVEEFLELMVSPAAILSRHVAEDGLEEKTKLVELANRIPPQLGLAQLPHELFMSAQRLRAFNRRFNVACLGHNILHDKSNADAFSANPLNVARAVSKDRVVSRSLDTSVSDRYRLDAWDSLEPDAITLQGAAFASHLASGEALAVVGTDLSLAGKKTAKGKLRRALDFVKAKIFRVAIEDWEREQAERKKEMLERAIQGDVEIYLAALNSLLHAPEISGLINVVGVIIKEVRQYAGVAKPELMEAMSETIAENFEDLHPDMADYWRHIYRQIIAAREDNNSTRVEEWTKHILAEAEVAVKEIKTLEENRFYYPEHVASFRKKKNYKKVDDFQQPVVARSVAEIWDLGQGRLRVLHKNGQVVGWKKNADGKNITGTLSFPNFQPNNLLAARFLPPGGKQVWVVTDSGELRLYALESRKETVVLSLFVDDTSKIKKGWVLKKTIPATEASKNNEPVFRFNADKSEVYFGNEVRDLQAGIVDSGATMDRMRAAGPNYSVGEGGLEMRLALRDHIKNKTYFVDEPQKDLRGGQVSADYHGEIVLSSDQFYYVSEKENKLVPGSKLNSGQARDVNVQQVLSKDSCLVGVVERPGSWDNEEKILTWHRKLMIAEPGKIEGGLVVAKENVSSPYGSNPARFSLARLRPDGSVLVCKDNGDMELYDGEPVEQELIEKRLEAVGEAIKILEKGEPMAAALAKNLKRELDYLRGRFTSPEYIARGMRTELNYPIFQLLLAELSKLENGLKDALVAGFLAADPRADEATQWSVRDYLKSNFEITAVQRFGLLKLAAPDYSAVEKQFEPQKEYFGILNAFTTSTQFVLDEIKKRFDLREDDLRLSSFTSQSDSSAERTDEATEALQKLIEALAKDRDSLAVMLGKATHINSVPLSSGAALSSYFENEQLRPEIKKALLDNITAANKLPEEFGGSKEDLALELRRKVEGFTREIGNALVELKHWRNDAEGPAKNIVDSYLNYLNYYFIRGNDIINPEDKWENYWANIKK